MSTTSSKISHQKYEENSAKALKNCGSFISNAFFSGFWHLNSPTQLHHTDEDFFWKLVDSHHEDRFDALITTLLHGVISESEVTSIRELVSGYRSFCDAYNLPFTVRANVIWSALYQARVIESCYLPMQHTHSPVSKIKAALGFKKDEFPVVVPHQSDGSLSGCDIYELGPGSGLLTALLAIKGANVISIETVQSHYCYQSAFFSSMFGASFCEAAHTADFESFDFSKKRVIHLPWWKTLNFKEDNLPVADVITSNHMLMECSEFALKHYVALANHKLADAGAWIFEGLGQMYRGGATYDQLTEKARKYNMVVHDLRNIFKHFGVWAITRNNIPAVYDTPQGTSLNEFITDLRKQFPDLTTTLSGRFSNQDWLNLVDEGDSFHSFGL